MKRVWFWLFLVFVFSVPLSPVISTRLLIVALAAFLIFNFRSLSFNYLVREGWDILLYAIVLMTGMAYTTNVQSGLKILETNFSLLAVLVIAQGQLGNKENLKNVATSFIAGLAVAGLICIVYAFSRYSGDTGIFFSYELTSPIGSHPTYMAYYLIFAITILLFALYDEEIKGNWTIAVTALVLFFFAVLILTGGITAVVSLLFVFTFFILKYIVEDKRVSRNTTVAVVIAMLAFLFIVHSNTVFGTQLESGSDYWERADLWKAAVRANTSMLLGVGTGDHMDVLHNYYVAHGMEEYARENFNAHNQFIQTFLSLGVIGLIALLIMMTRPLYFAVIARKPLGVLMFFPFLVYGMNEVFMGRYQGVIFFCMLHQLFMSYIHPLVPRAILKGEANNL